MKIGRKLLVEFTEMTLRYEIEGLHAKVVQHLFVFHMTAHIPTISHKMKGVLCPPCVHLYIKQRLATVGRVSCSSRYQLLADCCARRRLLLVLVAESMRDTRLATSQVFS